MASMEPAGYYDWRVSLKNKIRSAQGRTMTAVNSKLTALYWQIDTTWKSALASSSQVNVIVAHDSSGHQRPSFDNG
jgi:hypothetical protein